MAALILNTSNLNDNHKIALMRHKRDPDATIDVGRSFGQWFHSRADRDFYAKSNEPYPVFIVAAAGGGAYAAHYTATFLARMQDSCANFAQHVFAISGVSGGSIGASLFAGLAKLKARNQPYVGCNLNSGDRYFERRTQKFFEAGLPVAGHGGGAVPRPPAAVPPLPSRPVRPLARARRQHRIRLARHDRGRGEGGCLRQGLPSPFERPFLDLWTPVGPTRRYRR